MIEFKKYMKKSTAASGVPLKIMDKNVLRQIAQLLRS
jgi:hypothetical protein